MDKKKVKFIIRKTEIRKEEERSREDCSKFENGTIRKVR